MALAIDQLRVGKVYSALATANQYRKHAADTRSVLAVWQQRTLDALLDLWHGRFEQAAAWIFGESVTFVERLSADLAVPADNLEQTRLGQAYWLLREQGRMADLFASGLADTVERHGYFPVWRAGLALALCETGQYAEGADRLVGFAHDTADFTRFLPSGWAVPTLVLLAEVSAALDARGGFETELREVVPGLRDRLAAHDGRRSPSRAGPPCWSARPLGPVGCSRWPRGAGHRARRIPRGSRAGALLPAPTGPSATGPRPRVAQDRPPRHRRPRLPAPAGGAARGTGLRDGGPRGGVRGPAGLDGRRVRAAAAVPAYREPRTRSRRVAGAPPRCLR